MGIAGESCVVADAGRDAGNKYLRETESFCQTPGARCNGEKLATIESKETRVLRITVDDTETTPRDKKTGKEKSYSNHGARWRKGLQLDQSRRWSAEQNREQGAERRLSAEGRSPRSGALGRLMRAEGKRLLSLSVLPSPKMAFSKQSKAAPFIA